MKIITRVFPSVLCVLSFGLFSQVAWAVVFEDNAPTPTTVPPTQIASDSSAYNDQVIVKYHDSQNQLQGTSLSSQTNATNVATAAAGQGMTYLRTMATGAHVMKFTEKMTASKADQAMEKMMLDPRIAYVEPDIRMQIMATPSDPQYDDQWHYYESEGGLNLPEAWDVSTGQDVVVAVIDTGYRPHVDLAANILPGYDMISSVTAANDGNGRDNDARDTGDATAANECAPNTGARASSWHGTHVAGTVAAATNNGEGVAGVAYNAKVVPVRALGKCGGSLSDIADAMIWAAGGNVPGVPNNSNPAKVLNLSLGGRGSCGATSQVAIDRVVALGATVVVAAGNASENASNATPANCNNVVAVSAVGRTGGRASYSNFGADVDVAAPGGDQRTGRSDGVLSTLNAGRAAPANDNYAYYQGTSMAAPHVAGAAALLYSLDPDLTPAAVELILKSTARSFPATCNGCGAGIVDAKAAVDAVAGNNGGGDPEPEDNALQNGQTISGISGATNTETVYTLELPTGASNLSIRVDGGSGDVDLYTRFGARPTTTQYDCRPFRNGNTETCTITNPEAGTYYIVLRGYRAFSGVTLNAGFNDESSTPSSADSISETSLSASQGSWLNFQLEVPVGQSSLQVTMSGGSGDADLYVRRGVNPTIARYDCRPYRSGNSEACNVSNPAAGTWFVRVRAFRSFSGVSLQATFQ